MRAINLEMMKGRFFIALAIVVVATICGCKKTPPCNSTVYTGAVVSPNTVTDYDGNVYNIVRIGTQNWLQQNLNTAHYQNGAPIIQSSTDSAYAADSLKGLDSLSWYNCYALNGNNGAWCYYNGDSAYNHLYGKLYNWFAVTNPNQLCPAGFHVPSDAEWHKLVLTLDACATNGDPESSTAGSQLKAIAIWTKGDSTATNTSKFTAYPAGDCDPTRTFSGRDSLSYFWSSTFQVNTVPDGSSKTTQDTLGVWNRKLNSADSSVHRFAGSMYNGFSVRCVGN